MKKLLFSLMLLIGLCAASPASAQTWCFKYHTVEFFEFHTLHNWSVWNGSNGSVSESTRISFPAGGTSASFYIDMFDAPGAFILMDHAYDARNGFFTQASKQRGCPFDVPEPVGKPKWCSMTAYVHADSHIVGGIQLLDSNYTYLAVKDIDLPPTASEWRVISTPTVTNCSQNMIARIGFSKPGTFQETRAFVDFVTIDTWY